MPGALHQFLADDHRRLDALLEECLRAAPQVPEAYDQFRRGLLRHIAIEERVLFPALRRARGANELEAQLHRDHAALSALLVPPPTAVELQQIREIIEAHNPLEESVEGLYELVEDAAGADLPALIAAANAVAEVRTVPNIDTPIVRHSISVLVREAELGRARLKK